MFLRNKNHDSCDKSATGAENTGILKIPAGITNLANKRHIFVPYLVKVRDMTKSSNEGHIFVPHLVKVHDVTKSSKVGHIFFWTIFG